MKSNTTKIIATAILMIAGSLNVTAQSGGSFAITQSIIASGGGQNAAGGTFSLDGTIGQAAAGVVLRGSTYAVTSGFWNFTPSAPTAASVAVSGRVRTATGSGIRNAVLTLTAPNGSIHTARSGSFGYYRFFNVPAGETYIIRLTAKRFAFAHSSIVISVLDEITGLDFTADPGQIFMSK